MTKRDILNVWETVKAMAWKKIIGWSLAALMTTGAALMAFGRSGIDYAVRNSESFQRLERKTEELERTMERSQQTQKEFFGAMMDAFPEVRKAAKERAALNEEAARKRAEDSVLFEKLGGGR